METSLTEFFRRVGCEKWQEGDDWQLFGIRTIPRKHRALELENTTLEQMLQNWPNGFFPEEIADGKETPMQSISFSFTTDPA